MRNATMQNVRKTLTWKNRWTKRWEQAHQPCGLAACPSPKLPWARLLSPRTGTLLQGVIYCQPKCQEAALKAQLARLYPLTPAAPPSNRIPLGLLMVARGWLTHEQVVTALAAQQSAQTGRIGDWFEKLGFATEQQVTSALGLQWGCPTVSSLDTTATAPGGWIPFAIMDAFQMIPLHFVPATNTLYIAFGERVDHSVLSSIDKVLNCRTRPCVRERKTVAAELDQMRQQPRPEEVEFGPMHDCAEIARVSASYMSRLGADDTRLGRIGSYIWLRLRVGASHTDLLFRLGAESQNVQNVQRPSLPVELILPSAEALP
jgi:hypothetical protein